LTAPRSASDNPLRALLPLALLGALLVWTGLLHHGLGPRPDLGIEWYSPRGFFTRSLLASSWESLVATRWKGFLAFWTPALLLAIACWVTTRSALVRTLAVCAAIAAAIFVYYALGGGASRVAWTFFGWRASGTMLALAFVIGGILLSPWLAASWLRLGWPLRVLSFAPVALAVVAMQRGITGTNPRLPFAISPWPVVPVFGLEVVGTIFASLLAGAALGLAGLALRARGRGRTGVLVIGAGLALPAGWLALGSQGFLPFQVAARGFLVATLACAVVVALAGLASRDTTRLRRRARVLGTAALLLGLPLLIGQAWARFDYSENRDVYAQRIIDALAGYYEREQMYPETLTELVEGGELSTIPEPQVGFGWLDGDDRFTYQAFGTSYLLEFPAPRWVQCTYNPPYDDYEDEEDDDAGLGADGADADEDLGGAWSCPTKPPELW
jgi:hypothetical protein